MSASGGSAFHIIHNTNYTSGGWQFQLEDLAAYPTISDWDYNDFTWNFSVAVVPPPEGNSGGSGGYYDPGASGGSSGGTGWQVLAVPDSATTDRDTPVTIPVLANDIQQTGVTLAVGYVNGAANGTVTTDGQTVTYTPNAGFTGTNYFYYMLAGRPDMAGVTVTIPSGDLDIIDSNGDEVAEDKEESPGGWVAVNNDNYNFEGNQATSLVQKYDKDESSKVDGENDLVQIKVHDLQQG